MKRTRADAEDSSSAYVIDDELWMVDPINADETSGLIVVAAPEDPSSPSSKHRLFRCFKLDLARYPGTFQDMLRFGTSSEQYEGVSMVLLPDAAAEVKSLLRFLTDGT